MDLSELRKQIDEADAAILKQIARRMQVVHKIAELKKKNQIHVFQPDREVEMFKNRKKLAKKLGISEELTETIFQLIIQESRNIQKRDIAEEEESPFPKYIPSKLTYRKKSLDLQGIPLTDLFEKVAAFEEQYFFLESLGEDEWSEHSFLGFSPAAIIHAKGNDFYIDGEKIEKPDGENPLEKLEAFFEPFSGITPEKSFCGGLIGYMGSECAQWFDSDIPTSTEENIFPEFCFGLFLDGIIYDRKRKTLEYFYWDQDRSNMIEEMLQKECPLKPLEQQFVGTSFTEDEFEHMVKRLKEEIVAGNIFQIVPSRKFEYKIHGSLTPFYMRLREVNPSPHMFFLHFGDTQIIGSSPELISQISGRTIETYPIAGTRSRGKTPKEDAQKAAELLGDEKEIAEHMMLVDMARNDLGRICEFGTVEVDRLMSIKKFSHVQHIVSEVSGILQENVSPIRGMMSNFPMGTVCGSPRIEALKILVREEKVPRGPFAGAVGHWSFSGDARFVLSIRTLFVQGDHGFAQAGAGIVYDSVAEYERKEVDKKTSHIREILEEFPEIHEK